MATSPNVNGPQRRLEPELAWAIKEAKLKTRASWRRIARHTGLSHSYLVQLSNGHRVPSLETVETLAKVLPFEPGELDRLRQVAVVGKGRDRND